MRARASASSAPRTAPRARRAARRPCDRPRIHPTNSFRAFSSRARASSWRDDADGAPANDAIAASTADEASSDEDDGVEGRRAANGTATTANATPGGRFPGLLGFPGILNLPRGAVSRWDSKPSALRDLARDQVPRHVAIIMDGNSRWAERRRLPRTIGHERGVNALRGVVKCCVAWGISTLTVFAFSQENWGRNQAEIEELMALVETAMREELPLLVKEGVRVEVIGDLSKVNEGVRSALTRAMEATKDNDSLRLVVALSYGGRQDIVQAAKTLAQKVADGEMRAEDIDEAALSAHLSTYDARAATNEIDFAQAPDLLIRTSGEQRLSNFLLWDLAYTELYFAQMFWPEFGEAELRRALYAYAKRDRRFGGRT
jgi:undecaprenyl diphosphate synthase